MLGSPSHTLYHLAVYQSLRVDPFFHDKPVSAGILLPNRNTAPKLWLATTHVSVTRYPHLERTLLPYLQSLQQDDLMS